MRDEEIRQQKIILFDGICNLCNGSVTFVLRHEKHPDFRFASIQSETGRELLEWCGLSANYSQAVIFLDKGTIHSGSTAALKVGQALKFPWSMFSTLGLIVPMFIRDGVYGNIATHRYQWFGKKNVCMIPTEDLKTRFL